MATGTIRAISDPAYLTNAAANVYTPPASTIYTIINQIHLANVTNAAATVTLYKGGTGGSTGGTELCKLASVAANDVKDFFFSPGLIMKSTDFLTGACPTGNSTVTITVLGSQVVTP